MSSLLIIGGSGFFGKSILDSYRRGLLADWGIDRIEVVARSASNLATSNPELISKNVFLHDLDITNCIYLPKADYVIHAAASTDAKNYLFRAAEEKNNIQLGTLNFCKLAKIFLMNSKILYVSSGAIYGQQSPELSRLREDFDLQPIETLEPGKRDYAAAKRDGEGYIKELGAKGINVAIARCFAFVGPYLPRDQHFAIGNFIEDGLQNRSITVRAKKTVIRSYLYADDLVLWLMAILNRADKKCQVVNVGSDEEISIRMLAIMVANYFGVHVSMPEIESSDIDRYIPSNELAHAMGCPPPICIDDALKATIHRLKLFDKLG
jgi:nucleoside-diphosphate-sugar epimerase